MVLEHTRHMQIFYRYQGVVFAEVACEFVAGIFADSANSGMDGGYRLPCFEAVL